MEELKKRIREELAEARKKRIHSKGFSELYYDGKASAFAEVIEIVEDVEEGEKMEKKENLKLEIAAIHEKAKQLEAELKDMGLDNVIREQETAAIASHLFNAVWEVLYK